MNFNTQAVEQKCDCQSPYGKSFSSIVRNTNARSSEIYAKKLPAQEEKIALGALMTQHNSQVKELQEKSFGDRSVMDIQHNHEVKSKEQQNESVFPVRFESYPCNGKRINF